MTESNANLEIETKRRVRKILSKAWNTNAFEDGNVFTVHSRFDAPNVLKWTK